MNKDSNNVKNRIWDMIEFGLGFVVAGMCFRVGTMIVEFIAKMIK